MHENVSDRVLEDLVEKTAAIWLNHGLDPAIRMRPLTPVRHSERIGLYRGCTKCRRKPSCQQQQVRPDMKIAREEVFGPVLTVQRLTGVDDVMRAVNDYV